jgi:hypothetical protein
MDADARTPFSVLAASLTVLLYSASVVDALYRRGSPVGRRRPPLRTSRVAHSLYTRVPPSLSRRTDRLRSSLASPAIPAFPRAPAGSASASSFSGPAQRSLLVAAHLFAESLMVTLYFEGSGRFVTSTTAPMATGWSDSCRVGLSPTH